MEIIEIFQQIQKPGWGLAFSETNLALVIDAPNQSSALAFAKSAMNHLALSLLTLGYKEALIRFPGCCRPYRVIPEMAQSSFPEPPIKPDCRGTYMNAPNISDYIRSADYIRLHEFLIEKKREGKIVIITSQVNDQCIHTNDNLLPSRGFWMPHQFDGYNYRLSWSLSGSGEPSDEYHQMRDLLRRDGFVLNFDYRLIRPDGALCRYQTDFYHVDNYCGQPIRIGVSDPNAWELLRPTPAT